MKCSHCLVEFHDAWAGHGIGSDAVYDMWVVQWTTCPACKRFIINLLAQRPKHAGLANPLSAQVLPKGIARAPLSNDVPQKYAADYREACLVFSDSAKASAALSRRTLQLLLREHVGITKKDLFQEIDALLASKTLPSHLSDAVDGVRHIGNFAAHPMKSTNTGEVVDVEPGEAEWLLDTLEGLFDFYFVAPAKLQRKKADLNAKLAEIGKPPMK